MSNYFVGIDIGCGGAKACIIDDEGTTIGYGFSEHKITVSHSSTWSETDPDEYWRNIYHIIRKIIAENHLDTTKIRGVSVSSAVPAIVMVDRDGKVINKAYNFLDNRAKEVVRELKEEVGEEACFALSGYNIDEQSICTSLLWERKNRPDDYKRIYKVLSPDGYVTYKLSGKMCANYSVGTFFGTIFDIRNKKFDMEMCERVGINPDHLPELYPCEQVIGEVTQEAARLTGLKEGTPVIAGTVDAFAGWLAGGATEPGETQINLGTAAVLGVILGAPTFLKNIWNCIYPVHSEDNYVIFSTTTTGGYVMRHLRNNFSTYERFVEKNGGYDAYDLLNLDAEHIRPGADGLITLPYFMGARTPEFNVNACGSVFGWGMNTTKGHLVRSMMEGVAFSAFRQYRAICAQGITTKGAIVMNEGGAKSRLWRRIFTDVFGHPTVMLKNRTGAPYGNAILAGVSTGYLPDYSVAKQWAEYVDHMDPDPKTHEMYMDYFQLFCSVYEHLLGDYEAYAALMKRYE
ncbi:FGGY-family carbohydrate kinase [Christensenella intestinihominis]|uniref:FGGY-family carbohydrate kinase n=1 Tax=Christensenella intestinihominis TaxID=1851429 RepID=UPI00082E0CC5|nr:FGGY family carbohydrate kinase [Christensenella intestinihominis]